MKLFIVIVFILLLKSIDIYSQNDSLFSLKGTSYTIEYLVHNPFSQTYQGSIKHYYVKDSLYYNDTLYQKVDFTTQSISQSTSYVSKLDTGCTQTYGYICYINKRLYFKDSLEKPPLLINDFNLNVGDTFYFKCTLNEGYVEIDTLTVIQVDSVLLGGVNRKRITFSTPPVSYFQIIWIEGVGDFHHGFLMFDYGFFICEELQYALPIPYQSCVRTPAEIIYCYSNYNEIYIDCHAGIEGNVSEDFKINNPATTQLLLTLPENTANIAYYLYNIQGSLKQEGRTTNSQTEINVADLPRGMYILKVVTEKQTVTKKVLLQ